MFLMCLCLVAHGICRVIAYLRDHEDVNLLGLRWMKGKLEAFRWSVMHAHG